MDEPGSSALGDRLVYTHGDAANRPQLDLPYSRWGLRALAVGVNPAATWAQRGQWAVVLRERRSLAALPGPRSGGARCAVTRAVLDTAARARRVPGLPDRDQTILSH